MDFTEQKRKSLNIKLSGPLKASLQRVDPEHQSGGLQIQELRQRNMDINPDKPMVYKGRLVLFTVSDTFDGGENGKTLFYLKILVMISMILK